MNVEPESRRRVRRQGPAVLRGRAIPKTTTDQRLLDRRGASDWVHADPWRVLRIQAEVVEGFGLLPELGMAGSGVGPSPAKLDSAPDSPRPAHPAAPGPPRGAVNPAPGPSRHQ